mgnify:CR=1 FL=1
MASKKSKDRITKLLLGVGIFSALASTFCCLMPLIFFLLGVGGVWAYNFKIFAPYSIYFIMISIFAVAAGFWRVYNKSKDQECSTFCANPKAARYYKMVLWMTVVIIAIVLLYPYVMPSLLGEACISCPR